MTEINYTTGSMRRRRGTDKWEVTLSHTNPLTGETIRTYHTIEAKTEWQAEHGGASSRWCSRRERSGFIVGVPSPPPT